MPITRAQGKILLLLPRLQASAPRQSRQGKVLSLEWPPMLETEGAVRAAISETVPRPLARKEDRHQTRGKLLYALQLAWNGKQLGTSPVTQSSPRRLKIAPVPCFEKIFATGRPPAKPGVTPAASPAKRNSSSRSATNNFPEQDPARKRPDCNSLRSNAATRWKHST